MDKGKSYKSEERVRKDFIKCCINSQLTHIERAEGTNVEQKVKKEAIHKIRELLDKL